MSFPTMLGDGPTGQLMREPQVCLGPAFANAQYQFSVSGSNYVTPANVYTDGALTTPYPNTGNVAADAYGRFTPIYLDGSITYGVQCFDSQNNLVYAIDPYTPPLSTRGLSTNVSYGPQIAATGEVVLAAPAAGGTQVTLKLSAASGGAAPLQISSTLAGQPALIVNTSATTGAQTATFVSTNKPGTATSSPAGWLPIQIDGAIMYTPIWHGNNFTPYVANPTAVGEVIVATSFKLNGDGTTTATGGTATPSSWFTPNAANIGSGYFINIVKNGGISGITFNTPLVTTVAPSGAGYVGGNLTANFAGTTASTYVITLSTGQQISGCTFTNGAAAFTTPATTINATPTTAIQVGPSSTSWLNISNNGLTINENGGATITATYSLSSSITGNPVVATGTITLAAGTGPQNPTLSGAASLILLANGTTTFNGVAGSNWFSPTTTNAGANFWLSLTKTSGTSGVTFNNALGAFTSLSGGLTIGLTGTGSRTVTGTYQISANSAGTLITNQGTISLTASGVLNTNWSGSAPLVLLGNGTATLNGVAQTNWFSPTTSNQGSLYWINITRTGGTTGVNFSNGQGSWTNITNTSFTTDLSGTSGIVGAATVSGSYQIASAASGTPVAGSGTITINRSGFTVIHLYTSGTSATETILTGTTTVQIEAWGGGGGGAAGTGSGCTINNGTGGGAAGYARSQYTAAALGGVGKTLKYTVGPGGAGGSPGNGTTGTASQVIAGTASGFTTMNPLGGGGGVNATGGPGGTSSGGNQANTTGASTAARAQNGAVGTSGTISGDGSPHGGGGSGGGLGSGSPGSVGVVGAVFFKYS